MCPSLNREAHQQCRLYVAVSAAMLLLVLAGFARTFYGRSYFGSVDVTGNTTLPFHLVFQRVVLTSWFVLFFTQSALIQIRRQPLHRRAGHGGTVLTLLVVVSGLVTVIEAATSATLAGLPEDRLSAIVFGNTATLAAFSICFILAIVYRNHSAFHWRWQTGPARYESCM